jgi:soluble lytic murein transglycosylase-like protein
MASAGKMTVPAAAHDPPGTLTPPAMVWGPGVLKPPSGALAPTLIAQRDRRGVMHIFNHASAELMSDRDSPVNFLGRVSPALQSCIIEAAELYRLPIPLILALIRKESNFAHQAVSPKGAMGLMQLMPGTAALLGVRDPFDPRENILAGCRYFRGLLDYFQGNVPLALAGYNAGYHRVISAGCQVPAIKETQEFVTQVMGLYCLLEKHASGL